VDFYTETTAVQSLGTGRPGTSMKEIQAFLTTVPAAEQEAI